MKKIYILLLCIFVYFATIIILVVSGIRSNSGTFVYPLDDTYIHMALARNFADNGVWGVTGNTHSFCSSSPLWTLLLSSVYFVIGSNIWLPLVLNIAFGVLFIIFVFNFLHKTMNLTATFFAVNLLVFSISLPALTLIAMEHVLHILLTAVFLYFASDLIGRDKCGKSGVVKISFLAFLLSSVRYEGIFAVLSVCLFLLFIKKYKTAVIVGASGVMPALIHGAFSTAKGWKFFPSSVLLKRASLSFSSFERILDSIGGLAIRKLWSCNALLSVLALVIISFYIKNSESEEKSLRNNCLFPAIILVTILHLQFAALGWIYRYEAYLISLGLLISLPIVAKKLCILFRNWSRPLQLLKALILCLSLLIIVFPLVDRGRKMTRDVYYAMNDRYLEHVFPALFLEKYYTGAVIVLNDIGIVSYYCDCKILDVYGLGSIEPLNFRMKTNGYTKDDVYEWTSSENARIAIIQIKWKEIAQKIPDQWVKVCQWEIPRNAVFGDTVVGFFGTDSVQAVKLKENIIDFSNDMPRNIHITWE